MREAVTKWPFVPGSAVKGVLHDHHQEIGNQSLLDTAFGKGGDEFSNAGSLVFTDARLVCLPVRSFYGTFAWCTSPLSLHRLRRDCGSQGSLDVPPVTSMTTMIVAGKISDALGSRLENAGSAYLEDLDFRIESGEEATRWADLIGKAVFSDPAWRTLFFERFAIVHDDVFNFLCDHATQVDARVKIEQATRTVAKGALWYEESLPAETILSGLAWCGPVFGQSGRGDSSARDQLLKTFCSAPSNLQIGGKATVGRGQVRLSFSA
jgi:CRISPR-associated protein Cmr4